MGDTDQKAAFDKLSAADQKALVDSVTPVTDMLFEERVSTRAD
ncbi:hypothetical protein [Nakamurella antarctica]|nr:hypothetical protein [Nakamurella antarctica]